MKGIIVFLYLLIIPIFIVLFYRSKKLDNEKDKLNIDRENLYNRMIEKNKSKKRRHFKISKKNIWSRFI